MVFSSKSKRKTGKMDFSEASDSDLSDNDYYEKDKKGASSAKNEKNENGSKVKSVLSLFLLLMVIVIVSSFTSFAISRFSNSMDFVENVSEVVKDLKGDLKKEREMFMEKGNNFDERLEKSLGSFLVRFEENFARKSYVVENVNSLQKEIKDIKNTQNENDKINKQKESDRLKTQTKNEESIKAVKSQLKNMEEKIKKFGSGKANDKASMELYKDLEAKLTSLRNSIKPLLQNKRQQHGKAPKGDFVRREDFERAIADIKKSMTPKSMKNTLLKIRDGEKIDWANSKSGGHIITINNAYLGLIDKIKGRDRTVLLKSVTDLGNCFPIKAEGGFVVIGLRTFVRPTHFVYESVNPDANPSLGSAPRQIRVLAVMSDESSEDLSLDGKPLEIPVDVGSISFRLKNIKRPVDRIKVEFLNNHGHEKFMCVYRLRVYGEHK